MVCNRKVLTMLLSLVVACAFWVSPGLVQAQEAAAAPLKVGDTIPDEMTVTTMAGEKISLKKGFEKEYNLIQFMTTACSACRTELMDLKVFQESVMDKLAIYPISMDMAGAPAVERYKKKLMIDDTFFLDSEFALPPAFGFNYTPSIAVINKQGKILYMKGGYMPSKKAELVSDLAGIIK